MEQQEFFTGKCSQCGEELKIPGHLTSFACMYCGAKLTPEQLITEVAIDGVDVDALMAKVVANIPQCVLNYNGYQTKIDKKQYQPAFDKMLAEVKPVFVDLDAACRADVSNGVRHMQEAVNALVDGLEHSRAQLSRSAAARVLDEQKMVIAIFLVPMIGHLKLSISKKFCELLQKTWVKRYPKSPFLVGSYEDITEGFRSRFKLCFITTAVCQERGLPDDCAQLTAFRQFRDNYLLAKPEGQALVEEYYEIAPGIVTCINHCGDRTARYEAIGATYLDVCYDHLQAGRLEACEETYTQMVRDLTATYCS